MSAAPLSGRSAIVTGAGRGIGRATAMLLAELGAAVVVNDVDASEADSVAGEIEAVGGRAIANHASVAEWDAAGTIVEAAVDAFGGVDFLVNNAGITGASPIWEVDPADFRRIVEVNLFGAFHCTRHAAPIMKAQGFGRIVNLVSRSGITGISNTASYGAGKGGVFGLTNVCARDLAPFGVTVNGVNPSSTETRMVMEAVEAGRAQGGEMADRAEALLSVLQKPEQVAVVIAALCTEEASAINGEFFLVEGDRIGLFHPLAVEEFVERAGGWQADALADALSKLPLHALDAPYGGGRAK